MTRRSSQLTGWLAIAGTTGLLFGLDHFRMVNFHFNWFMAILVAVSAALVGAVVLLARSARDEPQPPIEEKPAETGTPTTQS